MNSNNQKKNSDKTKVLIAEYQEINNWYRHNNTMAWTMGTILIPLSLGILAFTIQNFKERTVIELLFIAIASQGVLIIWALMFERMSFYTKIRKPRLNYLEEILGMENHLIFEKKTLLEKKSVSRFGSVIGIRLLIQILIILFTVIWIGLIVVKYLNL